MSAWLDQQSYPENQRDATRLAYALVVVALEIFLVLFLGSKILETYVGMERNARIALLVLFPELYAAVYFLGGATSRKPSPTTLEDILRSS